MTRFLTKNAVALPPLATIVKAFFTNGNPVQQQHSKRIHFSIQQHQWKGHRVILYAHGPSTMLFYYFILYAYCVSMGIQYRVIRDSTRELLSRSPNSTRVGLSAALNNGAGWGPSNPRVPGIRCHIALLQNSLSRIFSDILDMLMIG